MGLATFELCKNVRRQFSNSFTLTIAFLPVLILLIFLATLRVDMTSKLQDINISNNSKIQKVF